MRTLTFGLAAAAILAPGPALAWGYEGHEVIANIARDLVTPVVRARIDAILANDTDPLTAHDMASESTWADAYRSAGHRETAAWHFADIELDQPSLATACFGFPAAAVPASAGPAQDCVVDKVEEFEAELAAPTTSSQERLLALKFLLHFVGDLHQPLHTADNHDRGGNCVRLSLGGSRTSNLHSYWDTGGTVEPLGSDPRAIATQLEAQITPADRATWEQGDPRAWAMESYGVAVAVAYTAGSRPGCDADAAPITLPPGYDRRALAAATIQLERAGVRLALELDRALGST